ncbi:MAG: alanine/glycine:cation symporter family protein [Fusobacterium sp.]|uniref:alanine/glycine:cation symporter family protein n=1 Tax=Fusobacterium sp. TaxID=68766 RepID=UPI0026DAE44E|nr:alanine/glycine:cation symporter family protein [Fusobacterium sp.]MDO4690841.1 alanine/glycine:cation symporter family protein [Fusobacterium sp.]
MSFIINLVNIINTYLWSYVLIALLIILGAFFTLKSGFIQFRLFRDMFSLITGKLNSLKDGESNVKGQVSAFQSFCISVASHVGTGNLAGVAIAVATGGPGALFWMWLIAILGSATSLVENTLAQVYKEKSKDGFKGGPAYYIEKALGMKGLGKIFSIIVLLTFAFAFNTIQANTIAQAFETSFNMNVKVGGAIIAFLTALVIFGGVHRIAKFSGTIVPIMSIAYIIVAIFVLIINITKLPNLFILIIESAFGIKQFAGGALGFTILQGVKRGLYSNEAGMGSAPNAAATSNVSHPVKQGLLQAFGVFVDTILICSATGFIVLLYPEYNTVGLKGIQLTQAALSYSIGNWGQHFITACIFLFAFSSVIGNYYYGEVNLEFLLKDKITMFIFRVLVIMFVYIGAVVPLGLVWDIGDAFMGIMALINIVVITLLSPTAMSVIKDYYNQRKAGKNPVFFAKNITDLKNTECWND